MVVLLSRHTRMGVRPLRAAFPRDFAGFSLHVSSHRWELHACDSCRLESHFSVALPLWAHKGSPISLIPLSIVLLVDICRGPSPVAGLCLEQVWEASGSYIFWNLGEGRDEPQFEPSVHLQLVPHGHSQDLPSVSPRVFVHLIHSLLGHVITVVAKDHRTWLQGEEVLWAYDDEEDWKALKWCVVLFPASDCLLSVLTPSSHIHLTTHWCSPWIGFLIFQ